MRCRSRPRVYPRACGGTVLEPAAHHLADFGGSGNRIIAAMWHALPRLPRAPTQCKWKWATVMGKHGEKKVFATPPFKQLLTMQVPGDGFQLPAPTQKNRRSFLYMPVRLPAPTPFRPAFGLKAGMQLAAIMQEGEHGKARDPAR